MPEKKERSTFRLILIFFILSAGIVTAGYIYYRNYEKHYRAEVERQLSAIAEMKVDGLVDWRKERLADASVFYKNDEFSARVRQYLKTPGDSEARTRLRTWITQFQKAFEYDKIFLLDTKGIERMSVPDKPERVTPHLSQYYSETLHSGQVTFLDFYRDAPDRPIHLSTVVPILDGPEGGHPIGLLVLRIDPQKYLYPFISRWPTPSKTAETLLVRREGNEAVFLNELKFQKNTALNLRIPIEKTDILAVKAVLGQQGVVEGKDYRGASVIGDVQPVPDSPWFLITRMDISEVYAPLRERLWIMVILIGALFIGTGTGVGLVWRHQSALSYKERYDASEALLAISSRQEAILSAIPDIIMEVDTNKVYTWANQAGKDFFGEDVIGREAAFYFEGEQEIYKTVKPLFDGNENVIYVESWQRRKDGQKRLLAWWCRVLKDTSGSVTGGLSTARDITDINRAESALRQSEHEFRLLAESMPQIVWVTRPDGWNTYFNQQWLDYTGQTLEESYGHGWNKPFHPDDRQMAWDAWQNAIKNCATYSMGSRLRRADGAYKWWLIRGVPVLDEHGTILKWFGTCTDIDDMKQSEEEIRRLNAELEQRVNERTAQLESANKELEAFAYSVSHDLRAPLRAIDGFSRFVLEDYAEKLDDEGKRLLNIIRSNTQKMDHLITDILELSRASRTDMKLSRIDMTRLVNSVYRELASPEIQKKVVFSVSALNDAYGDPTLIRQVWINLISNAIKYTMPKEERRIEIGSRMENNMNVYSIKDTGVGYNPDYAHRLFGLFQRLHKVEEFEGTGVGLAIVQRIILRHGGKVWAEGKVNEGATFWFSIPKDRQ